MVSSRLNAAHLAWRIGPGTGAARGRKVLWPRLSLPTGASTGISLWSQRGETKTFLSIQQWVERTDTGNLLTFPKINLKSQQVGFDLVAHQVLQGDQEFHRLLQRILRLQKEVTTWLQRENNTAFVNTEYKRRWPWLICRVSALLWAHRSPHHHPPFSSSGFSVVFPSLRSSFPLQAGPSSGLFVVCYAVSSVLYQSDSLQRTI